MYGFVCRNRRPPTTETRSHNDRRIEDRPIMHTPICGRRIDEKDKNEERRAKSRMDLPQPLDGIHYKYLTYDEIPLLFMSLQNSFEPPLDSSAAPSGHKGMISGFPGHDTLVWVMQSKGKRRAAAELFRRARILDALCSSECTSRNNNKNLQDEPRVLVQYPFGSTYRVRSSFLLPGMWYEDILLPLSVLFIMF
jgi:hypothetical protein